MSKEEYEAKDKKCVCDGLSRVLGMSEFYREYAVGTKDMPSTPETREKALRIVKGFLEKLKPEDACGPRGKDWLQRAKAETVTCEREKDGCMMALEWVRAAIHEDFCLDAKLTCQKYAQGLGTEFVEKQPWNDIRWAMYGLAHFGTLKEKDAVETIKDSIKKHSCG